MPTPAAVQPTDNSKPSDAAADNNDDKPKPYVSNDDDNTPKDYPSAGKKKKDKTGTSHFWRNILILGVVGYGAYFYYKRNNDSFAFVRYRNAPRNFGQESERKNCLAANDPFGSSGNNKNTTTYEYNNNNSSNSIAGHA
jgi:hypothetical protein